MPTSSADGQHARQTPSGFKQDPSEHASLKTTQYMYLSFEMPETKIDKGQIVTTLVWKCNDSNTHSIIGSMGLLYLPTNLS